jgi:hypothetical protein
MAGELRGKQPCIYLSDFVTGEWWFESDSAGSNLQDLQFPRQRAVHGKLVGDLFAVAIAGVLLSTVPVDLHRRTTAAAALRHLGDRIEVARVNPRSRTERPGRVRHPGQTLWYSCPVASRLREDMMTSMPLIHEDVPLIR